MTTAATVADKLSIVHSGLPVGPFSEPLGKLKFLV